MTRANRLIDIHRPIDGGAARRLIRWCRPGDPQIAPQIAHNASRNLRDPTERRAAPASDVLRATTEEAAARNDRPAERLASAVPSSAPAQRRISEAV
jgi:hypothetical protein